MVALGQKVKVHYVGRFDDGRVFDSTLERGKPLEFVLGDGKLLAGFELAVSNMEEGERCSIRIPCKDAFGPYDKSLIIKVPKSTVPDTEQLIVDEYVAIEYPKGVANVKVLAIDDENVTVDCNHELAGKDLDFDIKLIEIEAESAIEHELKEVGCGCGCDKLKESLYCNHD